MSQSLVVQLSDDAYAALQREAESAGTSPAQVAVAWVERQVAEVPVRTEAERQAARERFARHFGELDIGHPTGADNEVIDTDLAGEYAGSHEE